MSQKQIQELLKLSIDEKIELVQLLWDEIAREQVYSNLTQNQMDELSNRLERINTGKAIFKSWDEIRAKYQNVI